MDFKRFTTVKSSVMHIDLNSAFATIEQQANPFLRGIPIAVAAYDSPGGCILASSVEAKNLGIKTGMRVKDAKRVYPALKVLVPDPDKYRFVHLKLRNILRDYTNDFSPKSIDEFVLNFNPSLMKFWEGKSLFGIAKEVKERIKKEIGEYLAVSIGLGPNRFLAKLASNLKKPDGLEEINKDNFMGVYSRLTLTDLNGINVRNAIRLAGVGIGNVLEFYQSPLWRLKAAFSSINGLYWYMRLRGFEIDSVEFGRRSFGNSYALPHSDGTFEELLPILQKLCVKTGARMRQAGYVAGGIHLSLFFRDYSFWHRGLSLEKLLFDSREIYKQAVKMLYLFPDLKPVHTLAVSCFNLAEREAIQTELFGDTLKRERLVLATDSINSRWGDFVVTPARMILARDNVKDRIAFGGVKELQSPLL